MSRASIVRPVFAISAMVVAACLVSDIHAVEIDRSRWVPVQQTSHWCGAKALWLVAFGYGKDIDLDHVKQLCDPAGKSDGVLTLANLQAAATGIGLQAVPVKCDIEWLKQNRQPFISVHDGYRSLKGNDIMHCLVVLKYDNGRFHLLDPFMPATIVDISEATFAKTFKGVGVVMGNSTDDLSYLNQESLSYTGIILLIGLSSLLFREVVTCLRARYAALFLSGTCFLCLSGCSREAAKENSGLLVFDNPSLRIDVVPRGNAVPSVTHQFAFRNSGSRPCKILNVKTTCSCTSSGFTKEEIGPGEAGEVSLSVNLAGRTGQFTAAAEVIVEGRELDPVRLSIIATIQAPFSVFPSTYDFGDVIAGTSNARAGHVYIPRVNSRDRIEVLSKSASAKAVLSTFENDNRDESRMVANMVVTMEPTVAGKEVADEFILRNAVTGHTVPVHVRARVNHPDFIVSPRTLVLGKIPAEGLNQVVKVRRRIDSAEQLVVKVTDNSPEISTTVANLNSNEVEIEVSVRQGGRSVVTGDIEISCDGSLDSPFVLHCVGYSGRLSRHEKE